MLETQRLDLVPSTLEHLEAELQGPEVLGAFLNAIIPIGWPPGEYDRDALEYFHAKLKSGGPSHIGWYTWYGITRNADGRRGTLVAGAGYFGPPVDGMVEIGYSVVPSAQGKGFASEMVSALVNRAFEDPSIHQIIARTSDSNVASIKVLLHCGFKETGPGTEPGSIRFEKHRVPNA
jgi:RimJ/RimL family protein N-acetyltransferase